MSQSRIGKRHITVPAGVKVEITDGTGVAGQTVKVTGPKGTLARTLRPEVTVSEENGSLLVNPRGDEKIHRALHGLSRTLVANMVDGVTTGFKKTLEINGVGYRAAVAGKNLTLTMGYSHPVVIEAPEGITFTVPAGPKPSVVVEGIDKQLVGDMAAKVRSVRPPEPYKGKGIKYDYEVIRRKAGKSGGKKK
jgi:large subunit ribosomal protein L6